MKIEAVGIFSAGYEPCGPISCIPLQTFPFLKAPMFQTPNKADSVQFFRTVGHKKCENR